MKHRYLRSLGLTVERLTVGLAMLTVMCADADAGPRRFAWTTVVNNNDQMPGAPEGRTFNSYNQPSVNGDGLVVIRARSRGGPPLGQPTHGIYIRDMATGPAPSSGFSTARSKCRTRTIWPPHLSRPRRFPA